MRFSVIAASLASAAVVLAGQSTVYLTEEITITSCAPTVTNCPAHSTVTSTTSYPVITSSSYPVVTYTNTSAPATSTYTATVSSLSTSSEETTTITISACPSSTGLYSTGSTSGETTIPVIPVPVPSGTAPIPSGTGIVTYPANGTYPSATATPSSPVFTGSASSVQATFGLGLVAAVAAFFL